MRSNSMCSSYEDSPNDVKWTRCTYPILYNFNEFVVRLIIKMIKNTTINCGQCYGIFKEQFFYFFNNRTNKRRNTCKYFIQSVGLIIIINHSLQ